MSNELYSPNYNIEFQIKQAYGEHAMVMKFKDLTFEILRELEIKYHFGEGLINAYMTNKNKYYAIQVYHSLHDGGGLTPNPGRIIKKHVQFGGKYDCYVCTWSLTRWLPVIVCIPPFCLQQRDYLHLPCPICLENMVHPLHISYCQFGCGNSFHTTCIAKVEKCPLCRARL